MTSALRKTTGCHVCGACWWVDCANDADFTMRDVFLKRHGLPVYRGDVDLCAGHARQAQRENRIDVNWDAIEQALSLQKVSA